MKRFFLVLIFMLIFPVVVKAKEVKIMVLPFEIHAPREFSYLREALQDMLTTRLFVPNNILIIDKTVVERHLANVSYPLSEERILELGKMLGGDYVIFGSLTILGEKASLDAKIFPIEKNRPPKAVHIHTNTLDELIPKLSLFARQTITYIQGMPQQSFKRQPTDQISLSHAVTLPPPMSPNKMHPDRLFRTELGPKILNSSKTKTKGSGGQSSSMSLEKIWKDYRYSDIDSWPDYPIEENKAINPSKKKEATSKPLPPSHPDTQATSQGQIETPKPLFDDLSFPDIYH